MRPIHSSLLLLILISGSSLYGVGIPPAQLFSHEAAASGTPASIIAMQGQGDEITKANWQQHPQIRAVRAIVQSVKNGMSRKAFSIRKRAFEYCEPYEDTERVLATDAHGRARFYQSAGGAPRTLL